MNCNYHVVIVYSFVVMDIVKSDRNIMALQWLFQQLSFKSWSVSMIPITLLPQPISHGGREAGSIFYATEMVELADEIGATLIKGWRRSRS